MGELLQPTHLLLILVVALLIFGPSKLPQLGKGLGEGIRGFKDGVKGLGGGDEPVAKPEPVKTQTQTQPTEVK
ncbi:MAG TPA: twin-arginine translocase TatA/TatE family subunit [Acidobacteriaceae bacterium]|nr:twin-arginine translocase TatA/TatE family subunit [Acidobacteriaceae bacterium]